MFKALPEIILVRKVFSSQKRKRGLRSREIYSCYRARVGTKHEFSAIVVKNEPKAQ